MPEQLQLRKQYLRKNRVIQEWTKNRSTYSISTSKKENDWVGFYGTITPVLLQYMGEDETERNNPPQFPPVHEYSQTMSMIPSTHGTTSITNTYQAPPLDNDLTSSHSIDDTTWIAYYYSPFSRSSYGQSYLYEWTCGFRTWIQQHPLPSTHWKWILQESICWQVVSHKTKNISRRSSWLRRHLPQFKECYQQILDLRQNTQLQQKWMDELNIEKNNLPSICQTTCHL